MTRISVCGTGIIVQSEYRHKNRCKSIPGARWNPDIRAWTYPATPTSARTIWNIFERFNPITDDGFKNLVQSGKEAVKAQLHRNAKDLPKIPKYKLDPWLHQLQAYWFVSSIWGFPPGKLVSESCGGGAMLAMDMGTGKTAVAINLIQNFKFNRVLVVCPKSVCSVWPSQFEIHGVQKFRILKLDSGSVKKKVEESERAIRQSDADGRPLVIIINYESAWRSPFDEFALNGKWDLVIGDELHRIKSHAGKASKFFGNLSTSVPYRLGLTGTPMPHSPADIYAQYRFLDSGIFGRSFSRFRQRYAITESRVVSVKKKGSEKRKPVTFEEIVGWKDEDELNEAIYSIAYRATKDVLDLPEQNFLIRVCTLSKSALRIYKNLEKLFWSDVENGSVTTRNALTQLLRLQQITSGYVKTDAGDQKEIDQQKSDLLLEIMEDLDPSEPIVVFCRFVHDLDAVNRMSEKCGRSCAELSGRRNMLSEWQEGKHNVIAVQIQSGGVGVDMSRARYVVYYSLGFSLGDYEQSLSRVHRPGQTRPVFYYHLLAGGTVDEKVMTALQNKKTVIESILNR